MNWTEVCVLINAGVTSGFIGEWPPTRIVGPMALKTLFAAPSLLPESQGGECQSECGWADVAMLQEADTVQSF